MERLGQQGGTFSTAHATKNVKLFNYTLIRQQIADISFNGDLNYFDKDIAKEHHINDGIKYGGGDGE